MKKYTFLLFVSLLFSAVMVSAQTNLQLTRYPLFNFRVSGIFDVNIINLAPGVKTGYLHGTIVKKQNNQTVVQVSSSLITLESGLNLLSSQAIGKTFSQIDAYTQTSDKLGFGDHEVCITFKEAGAIEPSSSECTLLESPAYTLPYLVFPYNESVLGNKTPNLMWSVPVVQQSLDVKYKLELAEVLSGQQPGEAIINNFKLVQTDLLTANNLFYPSTANELRYNKTYAWQVTTYINDYPAGKTEVWSFTLLPDTFIIPDNNIPLNYIIISDLNLEGIYSTKDNKLYIELDEKYVHDKVSFTVYKDEAMKTSVCDITETKKTGLNLYTLSFTNCRESLAKDKVYFLAVKSNNKVYRLKFKFKS